MKKRPLLLVAMMLFANVAFTQNFSHTIYGVSKDINQPGETHPDPLHTPVYGHPGLGNEVGTLVGPLSDGGAIIAGYRAELDGNGDIFGAHTSIFRIEKNNTSSPVVVWEESEMLAFSGSDIFTDMIISKAPGTTDEYAVIVGGGDRSSPESNNKPFIFKVDAATGSINWHIWEDRTLPGGIVYHGVCELDNGNYVAVGTYNPIPNEGTPVSFMSVYDNNLNLLYHKRIDYFIPGMQISSNQSDGFFDIVAEGNNVYIVGNISLGEDYDGSIITLSSITPGTTPGAFTINWWRSYSLSYTHDGNSYDYVYPQDLFIVDNQSNPDEKVLIISSETSPQVGNHTEHQHVITRVDNIRPYNVPVLSDFFSRYVDNKKTSGGGVSFRTANTSALYPMSENHFFIAESPSDIYYSPSYNGFGLDKVSDGWVTEISDFTNGIVSSSYSIGMDAKEAIIDMSYDAVSEKIIMVGYQIAPIDEQHSFRDNGTDIYYGEFTPPLPFVSDAGCPHPSETVELPEASNEEFALGRTVYEYTEGSYYPLMSFLILLQHVDACGDASLKPGPNSVSNTTNNINEITIHPNPANSYVTLDMFSTVANDIRIDVVDVSGKVLISNSYSTNKGENSFTFDVRSLPGGVYVLKVYDGGTVAVEKLIKQ